MKTGLSTKVVRILVAALQIAAFVFYARTRALNSQIVHEPRAVGDSSEYLRIAALPVLSGQFWSESKPPVTSLFYKLAGGEPGRIFAFQLYFSILCWGILSLAVASAVKSDLLKVAGFCLILAFSLSRDIFMWDPFVGSESITISITALCVATALWCVGGWSSYKSAILVVVAFLAAFGRDTLAWLLLLITALLLPGLWITSRRKDLLALIAAFVVIFAASIVSARGGQRQEYNFASNMSFRVFPNADYLAFFERLGMPADPALVEESHHSLTPGHYKWTVFQALLLSPEQEPFRQWVRANGTRSFLGFLWFFKEDTLQGMFAGDAAKDVFYPDVYYYTATGYRPIIKSPWLAELLYPTRFGMLYFFVANLIAAVACGYALARGKGRWLLPIFMILITYPQAFLVWNGDPNDVARHSVGHNITERLGLWMLLLFMADAFTTWMMPHLSRLWNQIRTSALASKVGFGGAS